MSLTAEQRKRVAEACTGKKRIEVGETAWHWGPRVKVSHKYALVKKIASLIGSDVELLVRFIHAINTDNTADLEQLCFELITPEAEREC